jgi:hypothetical protein
MSVIGVERIEPAIEGRDINASLPNRHAPIDHIATGITPILTIHLGDEGPTLFAGFRVQGIDSAPIARCVHNAVHDQRGCLQATHGFEIIGPRQSDTLDVPGIDLGQRREIAALPIPATAEPLARFIVRLHQAFPINAPWCAFMTFAAAGYQKTQAQRD